MVSVGCAWALGQVEGEPEERGEAVAEPTPHAGPAVAPIGPVRWIVAGGGPTPDHNQVQIEQDLALARDLFRPLGPGLTLFAGGEGSRAVQVLDPEPDGDALRSELGALLAPRPGRDARYRAASIVADGAASAEAILAALEGALPDGDGPLTVYLAGHGVGGEQPRQSRMLTWGPGELGVEDVAAVLDEIPGHRPVRFVVTTCYSGGFAELVFTGADPEQGAATTDRCGLFATAWDRTAGGCDPSPDRGAHDGYGIHFLRALRGLDGEERPIEASRLDLDRDGTVSLLEAHTYARIESGSLDVPTTTSSWFLRAAVDPEEPPPERAPTPSLPEERAVIHALTARLDLRRSEDVFERLEREGALMERLATELDAVEEALASAEEVLVAALLHRWPLLDDPWHPGFAALLAAERDAIATFLADSGEAARRRELLEERDRLAEEHDRRLVETAPLERLAEALETVELAAHLFALGGRHWLRYQALLACERGRP